MAWCTFSTFSSVSWWCLVWTFKILNQIMATSEMWIPFTGPRGCFLKVKPKFYANSLFLMVCHVTALRRSQKSLITSTINCHMHKNATFSSPHQFTISQLGGIQQHTATFYLVSSLYNQSRNFWLTPHMLEQWIMDILIWGKPLLVLWCWNHISVY